MSTTHTPGPWTVHKSKRGEHEKDYSPFEILRPLVNEDGEFKGKIGGYHVVMGRKNCLPGYILTEAITPPTSSIVSTRMTRWWRLWVMPPRLSKLHGGTSRGPSKTVIHSPLKTRTPRSVKPSTLRGVNRDPPHPYSLPSLHQEPHGQGKAAMATTIPP